MKRQPHDPEQIARVTALADKGIVERIVIGRNGLIGCGTGPAIIYAGDGAIEQ